MEFYSRMLAMRLGIFGLTAGTSYERVLFRLVELGLRE